MIPTVNSPRLAGKLRPAQPRTLPAVVGLVLWAMGACLPTGMAGAQPPDTALQPGAKVRVNGPATGGKWIEGLAFGWTGDTLAFRADRDPGNLRRIAVDERTRVKMRAGEHDRLVMGLLIGGGVGLLVGGVIVGVEEASNGMGEIGGAFAAGITGLPPPPHKEVSQAPIYIGLGAGALIGAALGMSARVDRWVPVRLPGQLAFGITSDGAAGIRLGLSVSR